jgi:hypothetical protein
MGQVEKRSYFTQSVRGWHAGERGGWRIPPGAIKGLG